MQTRRTSSIEGAGGKENGKEVIGNILFAQFSLQLVSDLLVTTKRTNESACGRDHNACCSREAMIENLQNMQQRQRARGL